MATEFGNGLAVFGLVRTVDQGQTMGQQLQTWRSVGGQRAWLSMLIDTMEEISRPEMRAVALHAQLARPAQAMPYAAGYGLRN